MNIINLRKVGSYEISDSFSGILRISPNEGIDDPSDLLKDTSKEIFLSDSAGNKLPLSFIPKIFSSTILDGRKGPVDLINLCIKADTLYVSNELNIKQTVYIGSEDGDGVTPPIIFSKNSNAVGYPFESPDNDREGYKYDYVLGARGVDRYLIEKKDDKIHNLSKLNSDNPKATYTQLSFLPIEPLVTAIVNDKINSTSSVARFPVKGRYTDLNIIGSPSESNNSGNDLAKELFGDTDDIDTLENTLKTKAPIMGVGVQPGTIHYNAIPAHRYFFHLNRYKNKDLLDGPADVLITQYALCDGSLLPHSIELSKSKDDTKKVNISKTPPLFDLGQLSLRFLRGLNWVRDNNKLVDNRNIYLKIDSKVDDKANHAKNISTAGLYHASIDNQLQRNWKHCHLGFTTSSNTPENDTLYEYKNYFAGYTPAKDDCPNCKNSSAWKDYVKKCASYNGKGEFPKFAGSMILPTIGGLLKKGETFSEKEYEKLRNYPIAIAGGPYKHWWTINGCLRFGKRRLGKCRGSRTRLHGEAKVRDGGYKLASALNNKSWRFVTSLPELNKYENKNKASIIYNKNNKRELDDSLPSPPAVNFIPLMKI